VFKMAEPLTKETLNALRALVDNFGVAGAERTLSIPSGTIRRAVCGEHLNRTTHAAIRAGLERRGAIHA